MKFVEIRGERVPALGFGTWQITGGDCVRMVRYALDVGYRHIDTAQIYENEAEVGRGLAESGVAREDIFLTTKVWMDSLGQSDVQTSVEESLRKLKTDHVDLLLIHWPNPDFPLGETLSAMAEMQAAGKARHIGVSNFTVEWMRRAVEDHGADILCNQVEYHPFLRQSPVLDFVRAHDMMMTAYSPLARGRVAKSDVIVDIARKHGKTPAQVALRWLIDQDRVAAIPKAASEAHCRGNLDIFDFEFDAGDRTAIDAIGGDRRLVDPAWAPDWDRAR